MCGQKLWALVAMMLALTVMADKAGDYAVTNHSEVQ